jgi:hypothetical protein
VSVAQCLADAARVARDLERALDAKRDAAIRADVAARLTDEPPHIPSWIRK